MIKERIKSLSAEFHADAIAIRRHLHRHPELSFEEVETGKFIAARLQDYGIPHETGWAGNGVVALVRGERPGPQGIIALRADIDALPISEASDVPYRSQHSGVMHACGHDVHTAALLGASRILHALRAEFSGVVKLIFQPAEERLPGGASLLIAAGVLENPKPAAILGQHVSPDLPVGKVGFRPGMFMASSDEIYVTVRGRGGHGAMPHQCVDTILIASHLIVALQQIVSRNGNPLIPAVLTFGKIDSLGGATNIIPGTVKIQGTFRTMNEEWRSQAHELMQRLAQGLVTGMGGECEFDIVKGYPYLENNESLTLRARECAAEYLGAEQVVDLPMRMTSEDFAWYSQQLPACFYRLGTGTAGKSITPLHTDTFDVDEDCLLTGMGLMSWLAVRELARGE